MSPASTNAVFSGSCTALVTPFKNGQIDKDAFCKLVDWQIENGTAALIPVGTTGESPTLSHEEHDLVVELCIKQAAGRVPVIAGAGSNSTAEAVRLAKHGAAAGADAVLIVSPYYNKPTQEGLYQHFSAVAKAVSVPVIVYDIPGRSIVKVDDATMVRLAADHAKTLLITGRQAALITLRNDDLIVLLLCRLISPIFRCVGTRCGPVPGR